MSQKMSKLTPKKKAGIRALLETRSIAQAAEKVGITARTIYRWLGDPEFRAELAQAEGIAIDTAQRNLVRLADSALAIISHVLADNSASSTVRLRAAQMVLDNLIQLREMQSFEERISALEKVVNYGNTK